MSTPHPSNDPPVDPARRLAELRGRWVAQYGTRVAAQLDPDRRYSLVRVGSDEYAFTDYDRFTRALRHVWDSQLVPEPLPAVLGSELLDVASSLQAVNPDLDDLPES
jgi:hypothetical protein